MHAFVVRPVLTGLLALIIAGLWGMPLGSRSGAPAYQSACPAGAPEATGPAVIGAMIRRGVHC
jgi:hypothetical protein